MRCAFVCLRVLYVLVYLYTSSPTLMFTVFLSSSCFKTFLPVFCQRCWEPHICHFAKHIFCNIHLLGSQKKWSCLKDKILWFFSLPFLSCATPKEWNCHIFPRYQFSYAHFLPGDPFAVIWLLILLTFTCMSCYNVYKAVKFDSFQMSPVKVGGKLGSPFLNNIAVFYV